MTTTPLNRGSPKVVDARYDSPEEIQIDEVGETW
jgi:hypothetical protein